MKKYLSLFLFIVWSCCGSLERPSPVSTTVPESPGAASQAPGGSTPDGDVALAPVGTTPNESQVNPQDEIDLRRIATQKVHFNEVVTDPQQDWNDSSGGDGIVFNPFPGKGTVGSTDEWIELKNESGETVNASEWKVLMRDGTDEEQLLNDPALAILFSDGGNLGEWNDSELLILGNPKGDMKNSLTLELFDDGGELVDQVIVENADASSSLDESFQLNEDFLWQQGNASIRSENF